MQELHELQSVSTPEHLDTNRAAMALRAGQTTVTLSAPANDLLLRFLQGPSTRMGLVLGIVNEHVRLEASVVTMLTER